MPRRPPKKWFYSTVKAVKKVRPLIDDPEAFTGWLWYHHLKPGTKKDILTEERIIQFMKKYKKSRKGKRAKGKQKPRLVALIEKTRKARKARKHRKASRKRILRRVKPVLIIKRKHTRKGKVTMSKKRRKSSRRRHARVGFEGLEGRRSRRQIIVMGRGRRRHRRRGLLMGGGGLVNQMGGNTLNVAAGLAGGVGGAYIANMLPIENTKIKAAMPLVLGIVVASMARMPALKMAGLGLGIMGGMSILKQYLPAGMLLAGETPMMLPETIQRAIEDRTMGRVIEPLSGDYITQANM